LTGAARPAPARPPWRLVREGVQRLSWGVADQAVGALTNFLLSIYIARTLGAVQFGSFTLAYVTYGFANNISRGLAIEPLLTRFSGLDLAAWRRAAAGSTGTALVVGLVTGACASLAGWLMGGTTGLAFLALGMVLPGLMLQDSWRYALFAQRLGHHAFLNDLLWAAVQVCLLLVLRSSGHANVFGCVLAWGAGAAVGAVVGAWQAGVVPSLARVRGWLAEHRDIGPRYLAENTGNNASDTFRSFAVSGILGLASVGYIQAAGTLMGPFRIIYLGLSLIVTPEAVRILRRSPRRLPLFCLVLSVGLALLALAWGTALLVAMPRGLGDLTLGELWHPTYPLVLPSALALISAGATLGAVQGLRALNAARRSLRAVLAGSVVVLAATLVGAELGGLVPAMYCYGIASWVSTLLTWTQFRTALQEADVPLPVWLLPPRPRPPVRQEAPTEAGIG